jgi:hypothetical protein
VNTFSKDSHNTLLHKQFQAYPSSSGKQYKALLISMPRSLRYLETCIRLPYVVRHLLRAPYGWFVGMLCCGLWGSKEEVGCKKEDVIVPVLCSIHGLCYPRCHSTKSLAH